MDDERDETEDRERRGRSAWPWIPVAVLALTILFLLMGYFQRASQTGVQPAPTETSTATPTVATAPTQTTSATTTLPEPPPPVETTSTAQEKHTFGGSPATVSVPDVLGVSRATASSRIEARGLTPYGIARPKEGGYGAGLVWDQYPPAGTRIVEGSQVTFLFQGMP